jgi:hypothetical protein
MQQQHQFSCNILHVPRAVEWDSGTYLNLKLLAVPGNKLLAVPGNNDSPAYLMPVRYFDIGTPEEWLMFQKALWKVLIGQNITTGPPSYGMSIMKHKYVENLSLRQQQNPMK